MSAVVAPMLCARIYAGMALLEGSSLPMVYSAPGNASGGRDAPLISNTGIELQIMVKSGVSGRLKSVESVMPSIMKLKQYGVKMAIQVAAVLCCG